MQDSRASQYIAVDQTYESATNPRQTLEQIKLEELAESICQHGLLQPVTIRPNASGFESVRGARHSAPRSLSNCFLSPLASLTLTMPRQLVENSQRANVHSYEKAQGFQGLLDLPGYDVVALVTKFGKSASHIYARLLLLQLIPGCRPGIRRGAHHSESRQPHRPSAAGASGRSVRELLGAKIGLGAITEGVHSNRQ